jgi:hypothetical protein
MLVPTPVPPVPTPGGGAGSGGGGDAGGGGGARGVAEAFERIGDAITQFLSGGGGGGIVIPQLPQPQVYATPVSRSTLSPVAVLLVLAGVGLVGWWVYSQTRRQRGAVRTEQ